MYINELIFVIYYIIYYNVSLCFKLIWVINKYIDKEYLINIIRIGYIYKFYEYKNSHIIFIINLFIVILNNLNIE